MLVIGWKQVRKIWPIIGHTYLYRSLGIFVGTKHVSYRSEVGLSPSSE